MYIEDVSIEKLEKINDNIYENIERINNKRKIFSSRFNCYIWIIKK